MWRQVTTNYSQPLTLRLPGTEAVQGPCEEEDRGDPAPSCGGVRGARDPSSRVEEVPQEVPTAGPEYSADSSSCPAALGSEEGQVLGRRQEIFLYLPSAESRGSGAAGGDPADVGQEPASPS